MKKIIFIHGGAIIKDKKTGLWRTGTFRDSDKYGIMGDRLRVETAYHLYIDNPDCLIINTCGKGQYADIPGIPPVKKVIKQELLDLGVPANRIMITGNAGTTYQELRELEKLLGGKNLPKRIWFVSNIWHLPRVRAVIKYKFRNFEKYHVKMEFIEAERYLKRLAPGKWSKIIEKTYKSAAMKKRLTMERKGVKEIKQGVYKFIK